MVKEKYVAYVGTYTHGQSEGIHIYDLDTKAGRMEERKVVKIHNPSYITKSGNGKFLYSIADEGVVSFNIMPDGDLEMTSTRSIMGMRGCHLSTDKANKYLFVAGYHDGKVTVMKLNEDGTIGDIADQIFHKGLGSIAERNFRPHVNCVTLTPDEKYLCAVDLGVDHVKLYKFNHETGKIKLVDFLGCELESAPRHLRFSQDGKFAYVICELKNYINVYSYDGSGKSPQFEFLQNISTIKPGDHKGTAAAAMEFSMDGNYLFCSNAGDNSVGIYKIDKKTGLLTMLNVLPISGDYPKDIEVFPDGRFIVSLNHESNEMTIFRIDYEKGLIVLNGRPISIEMPNCILFSKTEQN